MSINAGESVIQYYVTNDRMMREDGHLDEDDRLQIEAVKKLGPVEFITYDQFIEKVRTEEERGIRTNLPYPKEVEGFITIKSMPQLMGISYIANKKERLFSKMTRRMTRSQAEYIRKLRVEQAYTWRLIARACFHQHWQGWKQWAPISNQLMGMALCLRAARMFKEDFRAKPWN